jgi:hypothetical protein
MPDNVPVTPPHPVQAAVEVPPWANDDNRYRMPDGSVLAAARIRA